MTAKCKPSEQQLSSETVKIQ